MLKLKLNKFNSHGINSIEYKRAFVFHEEEFKVPAPSECREKY